MAISFWKLGAGLEIYFSHICFSINKRLQLLKENNEKKRSKILYLVPNINIISNDAETYNWTSINNDPGFKVQSIHGFKKGWYKLSFEISAACSMGLAKLYIDYGKGYTEKNSISIAFRNEDPIELVIRLKHNARALRFDPFDKAVNFTIDTFAIESQSPYCVKTLMLEYLCIKENRFSLSDPWALWSRIRSEALPEFKSPLFYLYREYRAEIKRNLADYNYELWLSFKCPATIKTIDAAVFEQKKFLKRPRFSIIMPVYNPVLKYLVKAIDSVVGQSYDNWELCIADDCSTDIDVRAMLSHYASKEPRIKVLFRESNGHISEASNSALSLAAGDYVAFLDQDDELAVHALHFIASYINNQPNLKFIYTDEDKIDSAGARSSPHFKSDWNPDLFFSQNYISHLSCFDYNIVDQIGGFRIGLEGSQDYDLILRCLQHIDPEQIAHIPVVLYHWRIHEGSTAQSEKCKPYSSTAGLRALRDYFRAIDQFDVVVNSGISSNTYRVTFPLSHPRPLVSILIPTRDKFQLLNRCIESVLSKTAYKNFEIIIIDNGSREPEVKNYLRQLQQIHTNIHVLDYPFHFNYSAINNYAANASRGEILALLNNDVEVINSSWLTEMVRHASRDDIGCVGAKLYYEDNTIQHAGVIVGLGGVAGHSHKHCCGDAPGYFRRLQLTQNLSAVTGACMLIKRELYFEVGGMEENLAVAFNDVDFCLKVREAGYRNLWTPYAELYHFESKSRGAEDDPVKLARFSAEVEFMKNKWGRILSEDPYYNVNLSRAREDFSIASRDE